MDVIQIPFVTKVGITRASSGVLTLPFEETNHNHIATLHAGAQYALAESASGELLLSLFPELHDKVVPVLRDSQVKYRRPAAMALSAFPTIDAEEIDRFREQLEKKGRATIAITVELRDASGVVTCNGEFSWFVQQLEP